jgi:hypothetical protein
MTHAELPHGFRGDGVAYPHLRVRVSGGNYLLQWSRRLARASQAFGRNESEVLAHGQRVEHHQ